MMQLAAHSRRSLKPMAAASVGGNGQLPAENAAALRGFGPEVLRQLPCAQQLGAVWSRLGIAEGFLGLPEPV